MSRALLTNPAFKAAWLEARPYAEEAVRRMIAAGKARPCDAEHHREIWQDYAAFDAVSRGRTIEQIAAVQVPGFDPHQADPGVGKQQKEAA